MKPIPINFDFSPSFNNDSVCIGRFLNLETYQVIFILKNKQSHYYFQNWHISYNDQAWFWQTSSAEIQSGIYIDFESVLNEVNSIFKWVSNVTLEKTKT